MVGVAFLADPITDNTRELFIVKLSENVKTATVNHEVLYDFTLKCFLASGFDQNDADIIAKSLIEADLRGVNTHGVIRIPMYLNRVKKGLINPKAKSEIIAENDSMSIIDANNGMGQLSSSQAMELAISKATKSTIALVGVKNSNHFGTAAYYSLMAAEKNMIGISCSNTEPLMCAPGGAYPVVGNNPFSISIPAKNRPAIAVDMAMSAAAIGKIVLAKKKGESIPLGWATDQWGKETTDPNKALEGGSLLPFAGPKGYGLAIAVDVLAGILTGSGFGQRVNSPFNDFINQQYVGHMFIAINIDRIIPINLFLTQVDSYIDEIKAAPKAAGVKEVYLPGEIEYNTKSLRLKDGIPLPINLLEELEVFAKDLGFECCLIS